MSSSSVLLKSSLAKKYWMALTGLFLCTFIVVHLIGNLQLIEFMGGQLKFNAYAKFMTTFPLIKVTSYILYFSILFHAVDGIMLVLQNRNARPVKYAMNKPQANSLWTSRYMGQLGTIILVFIVTHMYNFWAKMHWGEIAADSAGNKDLWTVVYEFFKDEQVGLISVILYVVAMIAMGFHLHHGFQSAFQTLGIRHPKYTPLIKSVGFLFSVVIPAGFAIIPIYIYLS